MKGAIGGHFPELPATPKPTGGPIPVRRAYDPARSSSPLIASETRWVKYQHEGAQR